jgi:hypothetical protein
MKWSTERTRPLLGTSGGYKCDRAVQKRTAPLHCCSPMSVIQALGPKYLDQAEIVVTLQATPEELAHLLDARSHMMLPRLSVDVARNGW